MKLGLLIVLALLAFAVAAVHFVEPEWPTWAAAVAGGCGAGFLYGAMVVWKKRRA